MTCEVCYGTLTYGTEVLTGLSLRDGCAYGASLLTGLLITGRGGAYGTSFLRGLLISGRRPRTTQTRGTPQKHQNGQFCNDLTKRAYHQNGSSKMLEN